MRRRLLLAGWLILSAGAFCSGASGAACSVNIFLERKIIIGEFENRGDPRYQYLGEALQAQFHTSALALSYITLTDEERTLLAGLGASEEYRESFRSAGEAVSYRLKPIVERGTYAEGDLSLFISGSFTVFSEEAVRLTAYSFNGITGRREFEHTDMLSLSALLSAPESFLTPFFRRLVRYTVYATTVRAEPEDALIYIDDKLLGVGTVRSVLLSPGKHTLTVTKEGFNDYSDIISIEKDGDEITTALMKRPGGRFVSVHSEPAGAAVYLDEEYLGTTPLNTFIPEGRHVLTFVINGFSPVILYTADMERGEQSLFVRLAAYEQEALTFARAEIHKKRAKVLSAGGIAALAGTILLGVEKTLYEQKADLYKTKDEERSQNARRTADALSYLTVGSAVVTGGLFSFSFMELLKYFHLYSESAGTGLTKRQRRS